MEFIFEKYNNTPQDFHRFMMDILPDKFNIYKQNLINVAHLMSDDNVHDLRVAARRFIAVLNLYKTIYPSPYFKMIIKMVRKNFKNLGNIRDTHIMLENCQTMKIQFPLIYDFIAYLLAKEKKMVTNFSENISQVDFNEIEGMMYFLIRILKYDYPTIRPDFTIFEQRINENLKFLQEIYSQIDYSNTKTIHQFRIATKKYRYSTEILQDFVQDYQNLYKKLVKIQDDAGAIQDSVVLINKFKYFISKRNYNDYSTEFQISNILNFLEETQQNLIKAFRNDEELIRSVIYV